MSVVAQCITRQEAVRLVEVSDRSFCGCPQIKIPTTEILEDLWRFRGAYWLHRVPGGTLQAASDRSFFLLWPEGWTERELRANDQQIIQELRARRQR